MSDRVTLIEPTLLINAYCQGIFPMGLESGQLSWFSPDPRGILPIRHFHVPRSVRADLRKKDFEIRVNTSFRETIRSCGKREETWITREIMNSYEALHTLGYAHSVETWENGALVGGLYGVSIGGAFFGESMFSRVPGGSKASLLWLMDHLQAQGFELHDTQWTTKHLSMFGGHEIPRSLYMKQLAASIRLPVRFTGGT